MRHWIKVRLQDTELAAHAFQVVEHWRSLRAASVHVAKAIALYYDLTRGDTTLLREYFPWITSAATVEQPASAAPSQPTGKPKTRLIEKSADDDLADFLDSMGLE